MKTNLNIKLNKKIFDYFLAFAALLLAASISSFAQTTIYVSSSAVGSNNGSSWANAYTSFQSALGAASSGDDIWVAKGTYNPSSAYDLTNTSRFYHFRMITGVGIYGGFAGTETAVTQRTDYGVGEANETILSGDIGTADDNSDNCYHVFYHPSDIDATAVLDGFTITKGNANGTDPHNDGGGMYNSSSSPTINNSTFISNSSNDVGGGMNNVSSSPAVTNSLFILNTAPFGAGVHMSFSSPTFNNTTFTRNDASSRGGGIRKTSSGNPNFNNCIIWGNTATIDGNQIFNNGTGAFTLNYSCYANGSGDVGGNTAITATNNNITTDPQFVDSDNGDYRITGNSPAADAGNNTYNSQTYDIRGNGFDRKLDKSDGLAGTIDMGAYEYKFSSDPLPVELTSFNAKVINNSIHLHWQTATEVNNYGFEIERAVVETQHAASLQWEKIGFVNGHGNSNSPKSYTFTDNSNLSGSYSYRLKQIDFDGAFEYSEIVGISLMKFLQEFALDQNYPNPFNPTTKISFTIPTVVDALNASTTLKVYDVLGREVAILINEKKSAGHYEVDFNASKLSSGIYFYTLSYGSFIETKKMLVIK